MGEEEEKKREGEEKRRGEEEERRRDREAKIYDSIALVNSTDFLHRRPNNS